MRGLVQRAFEPFPTNEAQNVFTTSLLLRKPMIGSLEILKIRFGMVVICIKKYKKNQNEFSVFERVIDDHIHKSSCRSFSSFCGKDCYHREKQK